MMAARDFYRDAANMGGCRTCGPCGPTVPSTRCSTSLTRRWNCWPGADIRGRGPAG
ncbi:peptidase S15 domain protein [Mycobacterium xenopi 3993]|nr:peptidase S15 domain protein [Mycobacterium xenopi 3993]